MAFCSIAQCRLFVSTFVIPRARFQVPWNFEGDRTQGRTECTDQLTIISFTGSEADVHYTSNGPFVTTLTVAAKVTCSRTPTVCPWSIAKRR